MKIPYVEAKDSETNQIVRGFYFEFPQTTYCFKEDYEREPKVNLIPCVMSYRMTDWGLPNEPIICKPIDKSTLKLIGYIDTDNDYYIPLKYVKENEQDAEEQGLLLRLPCKVGDTVYIVMRLLYRPDGLDMSEYKEIEEVKVDNITIGKPYWQINYDEHEFLPEDFGKSIFLTKEEAEQALAKMKGETK